MIKYSILLLINLFVYVESHAAFTKLWDFRYGGSDNEISRKLYETLDHGFLVCGTSYSGISFDKTSNSRGNTDFWIVKTDSTGNVLWDKTYGGVFLDDFTCAVLLPDSGFLIGGSSNSDIGGEKSQSNHDLSLATFDFWIIKIDKHGNKIWDRTYGGIGEEQLTSITSLIDGTFLLAGVTSSSLNGDMSHILFGIRDYWVVKIDSAGTKLWDKNYGGSNSNQLNTVSSTSDKGFILAGSSNSPAGPSKNQNNFNNSYDYWIVKIDSNGLQMWDRTIGGDGLDGLSTLNVLPHDELLLGGVSYSNISFDKSAANHGGTATDYWLIKTDSLGNKIWDKVFGGDGLEDELTNIAIINNGFLITGTSYSNISGDKSDNNILSIEQAWVFAIDISGNKVWDFTINSVTHNEFCYGFQLQDGCFAIMSWMDSHGGDVTLVRNSVQDYWLAKYCMDNSLPIAQFTTSSAAFCQNTCLDFTNLSTNANTYQWFFPGGTPISSMQSDPQGICYDSSGVFDVILIAGNGNGYDTLTIPHYLTVYPQIPFTPILQIGDTLFSVPGYASYQWYTDSVLIPGAVNYYYVAQYSGNYSVIVTDINGCNATAFVIDVIASENEVTEFENFKIYSASDKIILESYNSTSIKTQIVISNMPGEIIYNESILLKNGKNEIYIDDGKHAAGMYIVSVQNGDHIFYKKIFIN